MCISHKNLNFTMYPHDVICNPKIKINTMVIPHHCNICFVDTQGRTNFSSSEMQLQNLVIEI